MGKGGAAPAIVIPQAPTAPEVFRPEELSIAEQQRRAKISTSKSEQANSILGASSDSDKTTLLKKNILGV